MSSAAPNSPPAWEFLNLFLLSKKLLVYLTQYCATHNLYSIRDDLLPHIQHQCKLVPYLFDGVLHPLHLRRLLF